MIFLLFGAVAVAFLVHSLKHSLNIPHDGTEPPEITPGIPLIGHVLGILRQGSTYYSKFANKPGASPVYMLKMPLSKIYVVTSPEIMSFIDRRPGNFSFNPILVGFSKRILTVSQPSWEKLARETLEEGGKQELSHELLRAGQESMKPGEHLESLTKRMLDSSALHFDGLHKGSSSTSRVDLYDWCRKYVTICGTNAIYGKEMNPYKDPIVADSLWEIHRDAARLGMNVLPHIIARGGCRAREVVLKAMGDYYAAGGDKYASRLIQARHAVHKKHGIPQSDIERFDMALSFGLLANSVPVAFWAIYHMYSDASLLAEVRQGIDSLTGISGPGCWTTSEPTKPTIKVNIKEVTDRYPLLRSFVSEVLRLQTTNVSPRIVQEDTIVDGRYLFKKGSVVMMPSAAVHRDRKCWGSSADEFDAQRFVPELQKGVERAQYSSSHKKAPVAAHRSWGRGGIVCPGRHFAVNELVIMLVMLVIKYDVVPLSGRWDVPKAKGLVVAGILAPVEDIPVSINHREGMGGVNCEFTWE